MNRIDRNHVEIIYSQKSNKKENARIAVYFEVGAYDDGESSGAAHFLEHMLVMGLNDYPIYSNNKIVVSATTDLFSTIYYIECMNTQIEICKALEVVKLLISGKTLNAFYMELVREDVVKEYGLYTSQISKQPKCMLYNQLNLPINLPIGNLNIIKSIKYEDIINFFNKHYTTCKKKIVIVGKYVEKNMKCYRLKESTYMKNCVKLLKTSNVNKYVFQSQEYLYLAWGNLLLLNCSIEKLEVIQIAFLIIAKKYFNDIASSFEICSYERGGIFFLLKMRKADALYNVSKFVNDIIIRLNDKLFFIAKKVYYHQRIKQKKRVIGELKDILFAIKNEIQINDKEMIKEILKNYGYSEFMVILKQIFN